MSQVLGVELRVEAGRLRVIDPATGERLLTPAEAQAARRAAEADKKAQTDSADRRLQAIVSRFYGGPTAFETKLR